MISLKIKNSLFLRTLTFIFKGEFLSEDKIRKGKLRNPKVHSQKTLLWLDDILDPNDKRFDWLAFSPVGREVKVIWVKSFLEFTNWIQQNGLPDAICFDSDLGKNSPSGYDCARWLIRYCDQKKLPLPLWASQSPHPQEKALIKKLLQDAKLKLYK